MKSHQLHTVASQNVALPSTFFLGSLDKIQGILFEQTKLYFYQTQKKTTNAIKRSHTETSNKLKKK